MGAMQDRIKRIEKSLGFWVGECKAGYARVYPRGIARNSKRATPEVISLWSLCLRQAKRIEELEAENAYNGPEPGQQIMEVHCPQCGATISVEHGDDEGEIAFLA